MLHREVKMALSRNGVCFILVLLSPMSAQVRFVQQPANITVEEGATMPTFTCQVIGLEQSSQVLSFEREHHIISDELTIRRPVLVGLGLDPTKYKVTLNINADLQARAYSLSITSPSRNDTSRFRCVVCRKDVVEVACDANHIFATSDEVSLTVNYPPDDPYPICTHSPPAAAPNDSFVRVVEGHAANFSCTSEIASPPVNLDWTTDGTKVEKDLVQVSDDGGLRVSRLRITPTKNDNGTVLTCTLTSEAHNETERSCSLLPLYVAPQQEDYTRGGSDIPIFVVLAVTVSLLIAAILSAVITRKKNSGKSPGHKIKYQPTNTNDAVNLETSPNLQVN